MTVSEGWRGCCGSHTMALRKGLHAVRKLIAGPTVYICDECVELSVDII